MELDGALIKYEVVDFFVGRDYSLDYLALYVCGCVLASVSVRSRRCDHAGADPESCAGGSIWQRKKCFNDIVYWAKLQKNGDVPSEMVTI